MIEKTENNNVARRTFNEAEIIFPLNLQNIQQEYIDYNVVYSTFIFEFKNYGRVHSKALYELERYSDELFPDTQASKKTCKSYNRLKSKVLCIKLLKAVFQVLKERKGL